ncbi:hypothetical protein [Frankia sp. ArI3]|nr:hypothetical protein [Frankia sp. ArI3]
MRAAMFSVMAAVGSGRTWVSVVDGVGGVAEEGLDGFQAAAGREA